MNNVAGIRGAGIIAKTSDDVLEQMMTINLLAPARLIQAALPFMKLDGSASIVNIGSIAREMGTSGMYLATKFEMQGLSDSSCEVLPLSQEHPRNLSHD